MRLVLLLAALTLSPHASYGQWEIEESHTTADLRGVVNTGGGVAWASGTNGTVLRTEDGGYLWQGCATPPGAEHLDLRGIQALDENTAIVMSSGKGSLSRLYRTTDGCRSWKLVFTDPDDVGFFDSLHRVTEKQLYLLGDPVDGKFAMFLSQDAGSTWFIADDPGLDAAKNEGAFAASNSSLTSIGPFLFFGTGSVPNAPHLFRTVTRCAPGTAAACAVAWVKSDVPLASGDAASGIFSIAGRTSAGGSGKLSTILVAVGGNYSKPKIEAGTAAYSTDGGQSWTAASSLPHGYRSAVAFDSATQTWIAVGPSGSDLSTDNGKTWRPLKPTPQDGAGTDANWNALALPFVVGPHGRIGRLRTNALHP